MHLRSLAIRARVGARIMFAESIVGLAAVDAGDGHHERAARLIGFAEGVAESLGGEFDPMERRLHQRTVATLRSVLAGDVLAAQRRTGRTMTEADAAADARTAQPTPSP